MASRTQTQRHRTSKQASRVKARRQRYHLFWKRVKLGGLITLGIVGFGGGSYLIFSGTLTALTERTVNGAYAITADLGFAVKNMYLDGRSRTSMNEIKTAVGEDVGAPILQLSLQELRGKLEAIPTVKHAAVERALPDTLMISLVEREPVALWQHEGKLKLIDDSGAVMPDLEIKHYTQLPLVVGKGAPQRISEVLQLLAKHQDLANQVKAVVRVGDRRWDVYFKHGVSVKLPQENTLEAWSRLAELNADQQILLRSIQTIDMRDTERMYITLSPEQTPTPVGVTTKET